MLKWIPLLHRLPHFEMTGGRQLPCGSPFRKEHNMDGEEPSGEQQRRIPLPRWTEAIDVMCTDEQHHDPDLHNLWNRRR